MNKKLMLLGLFTMGAFASVQANQTEVKTEEPSQEIAAVAKTDEKSKEEKKGCGCRR